MHEIKNHQLWCILIYSFLKIEVESVTLKALNYRYIFGVLRLIIGLLCQLLKDPSFLSSLVIACLLYFALIIRITMADTSKVLTTS